MQRKLKKAFSLWFSLTLVLVHGPTYGATELSGTIDRVATINRLVLQLRTYDNLLKIIALGVPYRDRQYINALRSKFGKERIPRVRWVGTNQLHIDGFKPNIELRDRKEQMFVVKGQVFYLKKSESFRRRILWLQKNWFSNGKDIAILHPSNRKWWERLREFFFPEAEASVAPQGRRVLGAEAKMEKGSVPEALTDEGAFSLEELNIINADQDSKMIAGLKYAVASYAYTKILAGATQELLTAMRDVPTLTGIFQACDRDYARRIVGVPVNFECTKEYTGVKISCADGVSPASKEIVYKDDRGTSDRFENAPQIVALCKPLRGKQETTRKAELLKVQRIVAELRAMPGLESAMPVQKTHLTPVRGSKKRPQLPRSSSQK